ncbi:putative kinase [Aspergillus nanangensis]|uniref:Kinase n=1 Tax=Aspergillus nanangensis TaxID=2582783 RepID=A0AAD4CI61_ASPNN|nr:putative kinase [Aspergillus nanangensis]
MEQEYARLAETIRTQATAHPNHRYLVAIAGTPGSGKTTTAEKVVKLLNAPGTPCAALLSMDGFHFPRSTLDQLPNREEAYVRRGAPWTFDAAGFLQFLKDLRAREKRPVSPQLSGVYAPTFDHTAKDPVENGIYIPDDTPIVVIEGNYLLLDEPVWREIPPLVDYKVFIDTDLGVARDRLAKRHLAAGIEKTLEDGFRRVDANDYLNGLTILEKRIEPDAIVPGA